MQIKNNYEKEVFNGDIGRVVRVEGKAVTVAYPERPEGIMFLCAAWKNCSCFTVSVLNPKVANIPMLFW